VRILRDHCGQGDEGAGVARPARLDRQAAEIDVVAGDDDLLRRSPPGRLRQRVRD